jgi:hypothetical protein
MHLGQELAHKGNYHVLWRDQLYSDIASPCAVCRLVCRLLGERLILHTVNFQDFIAFQF